MMRLTFAAFALLAVANGIQIKEDNIQELPEVEVEAETQPVSDKMFKSYLAAAKATGSVPVKKVMD